MKLLNSTSRKIPLRIAAFAAVFLLSATFSHSAHAATVNLGATLGNLTDTSVNVWIRASDAATFKVEYKLSAGSYPGTITSGTSITSANDYTGVVTLSGLTANTSYDYRVLLDDVVQATTGSTGTFSTAKTAGAACTYRFSVTGDFGDFTLTPFDYVLAKAPLFNIFIGDQVYADTATTQSGVEGYYHNNWGDSHMRAFMKTIPSYSMFDDHEFNGGNWDSGRTGLFSIGANTIYEYQTSVFNPSSLALVPGEYYYTRQVCDTEFFFTDGRTLRSKKHALDSDNNRMLGTAQRKHLESWLLNSTARLKFIVAPETWGDVNSNGTDGFLGFDAERQKLFTFITKNNINNVFILSGDAHSIGFFRHDLSSTRRIYELNATPLRSDILNLTSASTGITTRLCGNTTTGEFYSYIDVDTTGGTPTFTVNGYKLTNLGSSVYSEALFTTGGSGACLTAQNPLTLTPTDTSPTTATLASAANQTFSVSGASTTMSTMTITDAATATILAAKDIRIRIPRGLNMTWDSSVTTATIGGGASAKVSTTVTYEESNKVAVLNVTSNFSGSDAVTVAGLKYNNFTSASKPTSLGIDTNNDGGADVDDSKTVTINAAAAASFYSAANQAFSVSQSATTAQAITIVDGQTPVITSANDIRIRIPTFNMVFDNSISTITATGVASGKVSSSVTYEDSDKTAVINVTSNFSANDSITISGLKFKTFSSTSAVSNLGIDIDNNQVSDATDAKSIQIVSSTTRVWTGLANDEVWSHANNWSGNVAPIAGDTVVFDSTYTGDAVGDYVANNLASLTLSSGYTGTVTFPAYAVEHGVGAITVTGAITVNGGTLLFEGETHIDGDSSTPAVNDGTGYTITAASVTVGASGTISANGQGFEQGIGPGVAASSSATSNAGGSYGGRGGYDSAFSIAPGSTYGSSSSPLSLGSGGGANGSLTTTEDKGLGGGGGGALKFVVSGSTTVDGTITANGENAYIDPATSNDRYGAGSGGSIWFSSGTVSGSGTISATGGSAPSILSGATSSGGGGGRVSFSGSTYSFSGLVQVAGGTTDVAATGIRGHAGTVVFPSAALSSFTLSNALTLGNDISYTFGTLTIASGGTLTLDSDPVAGTGTTVNATTLNVNSGGTITATDRGYDGGDTHASGIGANGSSSTRSGGGSYGGRGGDASTAYSAAGGSRYGSASSPVSLGSGGGRVRSGNGGGAMKLVVSGTATIDGTVSADGSGAPTGNTGKGSGSGGSIWFSSGTVSGSGTIKANGGDAVSDAGAGGGGRISFNGVSTYSFSGTLQVNGGSWTGTTQLGHPGYAGTVYFPTQYPSSTFTLSNSLTLGNDISYTFGNLTIASGGTLTLDGDPDADSGHGSGGTINATNLTIASGGTLTASGKGLHDTGFTLGKGAACSASRFNGGGYGGNGGQGQTSSSPLCPLISTTTSQSYGSSTAPTNMGSGHLSGTNATTSLGNVNRGGGAIKLNVTNDLTVNGTLSSNGDRGSAGGSIWIIAKNYKGTTGTINTTGGNSGTGAVAGASSGAGGRIRIEYVNTTYSGTAPAAAGGTGVSGTGSANGSAGTVSEASASDVTAPTASKITVSSITHNSATVTWDTDEAGSSLVEYGPTTGYGTSTTETDTGTRVISHSVNLTGLSGSTTYHFRVHSKDDAGTPNEGISSDQNFTTTATPDTTPPVISNISATPTHNSVQITWDTDELGSSIIDYGPTASYGTTTSETDTSPRVLSHSVTISSLSASTTYHFRINSNDSSSNLGQSTDQTFTTSATPDVTAPVISTIVATPTETTVVITWNTDEISSSYIEYGLTASYGITTTEIDLSPKLTSHSITITGLTGSTTYHFRVNSNDASSNLGQSNDQTFITDAPPAAPVSNGGSIPLSFLQNLNTSSSQNSLSPDTSQNSTPSSLFTIYMKTGLIHKQVKLLQQYLNTHGFILTKTGAGSPGKETEKFGALTRTTLIKFQKAKKLTPDGVVGPKTRAYINSHK